jgi:hypothetical protein
MLGEEELAHGDLEDSVDGSAQGLEESPLFEPALLGASEEG